MPRLIPAWLYERLQQEHAAALSASTAEQEESDRHAATAAELRSRVDDLAVLLAEDAPAGPVT